MEIVLDRIESGFLKVLGLSLIALAVYFLLQDNVPAATLCAAVGVLLLFLARFSHFKRFKGWGFEAEIWEEKQQEAEQLVEALKKIATLTSREIMLQSIKSGRWSDGKRWADHLRLFEEIKAAQADMLDEVAKKEIRRSIDRWFLHDMVHREYGELRRLVSQTVETVRASLRERLINAFGCAEMVA